MPIPIIICLLILNIVVYIDAYHEISSITQRKHVHNNINTWTKRTASSLYSSTSSQPQTINSKQINNSLLKFNVTAILSTTLLLSLTSIIQIRPSYAMQGQIKPSSIEEAKAAVNQVKHCLEAIELMEIAALSNEYQKIGDILSNSIFQTFENAATILVRSDALSSEDKIALGTIKRYGVIADAIIMQGGLVNELRSGGINVASNGGSNANSNGINDEEADKEEEKKGVDAGEVRKYIKLLKYSLGDVYKIVQPISLIK